MTRELNRLSRIGLIKRENGTLVVQDLDRSGRNAPRNDWRIDTVAGFFRSFRRRDTISGVGCRFFEPELVEATLDLGASPWRCFRTITFRGAFVHQLLPPLVVNYLARRCPIYIAAHNWR